ncbi:MAG: hypothetical protein KC561_03825 [Myxococcales bacterium]|nr:hypothetical protein [Myxococcales bacterium]
MLALSACTEEAADPIESPDSTQADAAADETQSTDATIDSVDSTADQVSEDVGTEDLSAADLALADIERSPDTQDDANDLASSEDLADLSEGLDAAAAFDTTQTEDPDTTSFWPEVYVRHDLGAVDWTESDVAYPTMGFGAITGECGVLDTELIDTGAYLFVNQIDFGDDPFDDPQDASLLTPGGYTVLTTDNAGGSSIYSEVFAFEMLARCEGAQLLKTETQIEYPDEYEGSITDILVRIDGRRIGVSVVRAYIYPPTAEYTVERATEVLTKKLENILESSAAVEPEDRWVKQILHVIAYGPGHVESIQTAWDSLDPELRADTIVIVTESLGDDEFLY